jgi:hypothetical protein
MSNFIQHGHLLIEHYHAAWHVIYHSVYLRSILIKTCSGLQITNQAYTLHIAFAKTYIGYCTYMVTCMHIFDLLPYNFTVLYNKYHKFTCLLCYMLWLPVCICVGCPLLAWRSIKILWYDIKRLICSKLAVRHTNTLSNILKLLFLRKL